MPVKRFDHFEKLPKSTAGENPFYGVLIQESPNIYVKGDCDDDVGSQAISILKRIIHSYGVNAKYITFVINFIRKDLFRIEYFIEFVNYGTSFYEYIDADAFQREGKTIKQFSWNGILFSVSKDSPNITITKSYTYKYDTLNGEFVKCMN